MLSTYLCVYRRKLWKENIDVIDKKKINDTRLYSNFDNTAPHIKEFGQLLLKIKHLTFVMNL